MRSATVFSNPQADRSFYMRRYYQQNQQNLLAKANDRYAARDAAQQIETMKPPEPYPISETDYFDWKQYKGVGLIAPEDYTDAMLKWPDDRSKSGGRWKKEATL